MNLDQARRLDLLSRQLKEHLMGAALCANEIDDIARHVSEVSVGATHRRKAQTVRIKLTGWTARTAGEKIWPAGFSYQATSEDEGILTGRVGDFTELGAWVAACQGDAKILPQR